MSSKTKIQTFDTDWDDPVVFSNWLKTLDQERLDDQLWSQAEYGDVEKAKICISFGANPLKKLGGDGRTALARACIKNQTEMVDYLLSWGVKHCVDYVNDSDDNGYTAAHCCIENGAYKCLQKLIDAGADINIKNKDGESVIFHAIRYSPAVYWVSDKLEQKNSNAALCMDILIKKSDLLSTNAQGLNPIQIARHANDDPEYNKLADAMELILAEREKVILLNSLQQGVNVLDGQKVDKVQRL